MTTRNYLANQVINADCDDSLMLSSMLLVLHDAGLLDSTEADEDGAPQFALREDATDEQLSAAQSAFMALNECYDDAQVGYMSREAH